MRRRTFETRPALVAGVTAKQGRSQVFDPARAVFLRLSAGVTNPMGRFNSFGRFGRSGRLGRFGRLGLEFAQHLEGLHGRHQNPRP